VLAVLVASATLSLSGCGDTSGVQLRAAIIDTGDARATGPDGLQPLEEGLSSADSDIQRLAVRAVGRLEKPETIGLIAPLLASSDASVRAEAVNALGQAVLRLDGDGVADLLFAHLTNEEDAIVRGVMGRTLGRLQYGEADRALAVEQMLVQLTRGAEGDAPMGTLTGAVMGLESLSRGLGSEGLSAFTVSRLEELSAFGRSSGSDDPDGAARVRRTAMLALSWFGSPGTATLAEALNDDDPDVRRLSVTTMGGESSSQVSIDLLVRGLDDPSPRVRVEAVRSYAARAPGNEECPRLLDAAVDADLHVAIAALDLLAQGCADRTGQVELLAGIAAGHEAADPADWHRSAHALVSLASVSPGRAEPLLGGFVRHTNPFARVYAARAAAVLGDGDVLEALSDDAIPNVRTAAVQGLAGLRGRDADGILIAQLDQDDGFLLLTVARLLEGTPDRGDAVRALLGALSRMSQERRQTARDPRMALVNRIAELGGAEEAPGLEAYLTDYDPVLAERVAEILSRWTGGNWEAQPNPAARAPVPSPDELDALAATRVVLEMERGGEIEIRILAHDAPTHAARFVRLARSGSLDGLTYHRVVTNFVLQGGSPGANEFHGDAAYTRDELGLMSHWRGTLGTSTRGRDTGDGQMFINLIDNLRLDHNYTVFGEVVRGMDTADLVAEGDVITRARVEEG
jgi:cyclophilin family peptidyl-prolyl cis-trans isomerase/HEAT repeat protein